MTFTGRLLFVVAFVLPIDFCAAQSAEDVAIIGGHYFDTESASFVANDGILISHGKFTVINKKIDVGEKTRVIQLGVNDYILPGIVDCHAHYNVKLFRNRREEFTVIPIQYLANGGIALMKSRSNCQ